MSVLVCVKILRNFYISPLGVQICESNFIRFSVEGTIILMVLDSDKGEHSDKNNVDETNGVTNSRESMQADTDGEGEDANE
jgi:hypothetical protein